MKGTDETEAHHDIDILQLTIALRLLSADVLEKRLNALDSLKSSCNKATGIGRALQPSVCQYNQLIS